MLHFLFCVAFWTIIVSSIFYQIESRLGQVFSYFEKIHQVPCSKCAYFTSDHRLKCPVNPIAALTESAIECPDFQTNASCYFNNFNSLQKPKKSNKIKHQLL